MKLKIEKTNEILTIENWFRFAPPKKGEPQWVDGRSAKEFARYMLSEDKKLPQAIVKYIKELNWKSDSCVCYPEYETPFPAEFGQGEGRNHDALLVRADEWLIGIEAKVSEPFDKTIEEWLEDGKKTKDKGENRWKRIRESIKLITGKEYDDAIKLPSEIKGLRYQLISATVGTILEAQKRNIHKASLLVIEFTGDVRKEKKYDDNKNTNDADFQNYLEFLNLNSKSQKEQKITVPIDNLTLWINKIEIKLTQVKFE